MNFIRPGLKLSVLYHHRRREGRCTSWKSGYTSALHSTSHGFKSWLGYRLSWLNVFSGLTHVLHWPLWPTSLASLVFFFLRRGNSEHRFSLFYVPHCLEPDESTPLNFIKWSTCASVGFRCFSPGRWTSQSKKAFGTDSGTPDVDGKSCRESAINRFGIFPLPERDDGLGNRPGVGAFQAKCVFHESVFKEQRHVVRKYDERRVNLSDLSFVARVPFLTVGHRCSNLFSICLRNDNYAYGSETISTAVFLRPSRKLLG